MKRTYLHRPNLIITADFSSENPPVFRYRLDVVKDSFSNSFKTVCAIMQNPSYANEKIADKSVQVLERVVFEKGFQHFNGIGHLIIVNQFAFIQTNYFKGNNEQIGSRNNKVISNAIEKSDIVLIAWGKDNGFIHRQNHILKIIKSTTGKKLLVTSRHPSRVIYKNFIQEYST